MTELVRGPQDGGKVRMMTDGVLHTIYVGRAWLGDGCVAFSREKSARFPVLYAFDGKNYQHCPMREK